MFDNQNLLWLVIVLIVVVIIAIVVINLVRADSETVSTEGAQLPRSALASVSVGSVIISGFAQAVALG